MRNIETYSSKQMYPYLSLVERKVAEFYLNIDRMRWLVWLKWLIFITFSRQLLVSLSNLRLALGRFDWIIKRRSPPQKLLRPMKHNYQLEPQTWTGWSSEGVDPGICGICISMGTNSARVILSPFICLRLCAESLQIPEMQYCRQTVMLKVLLLKFQLDNIETFWSRLVAVSTSFMLLFWMTLLVWNDNFVWNHLNVCPIALSWPHHFTIWTSGKSICPSFHFII